MGTTRRIVAVVSAVLAVVLGVGWWQQRTATPGVGGTVPTTAPSTPAATGTGAPAGPVPGSSRTPTSSATPQASAAPNPASAGSSSALPTGCSAARSPMVPTRLGIPSMDVDAPVLSLGLADDGSVATPPFDQPRSVGWFNQGPRPGSAQGKVVLTAHTFHAGGALGNDLFDKDHGLAVGDVITLRDADGQVQCYRYTAAQKIWVKDYDPASTAIYDTTGAPMLALVICWDWEPKTRFWASRIVFYATPIAG